MAVKVAIIYYSATSTTYHLARAIEEGACEARADVRFHKVPERAPREAIASNEGWHSVAIHENFTLRVNRFSNVNATP